MFVYHNRREKSKKGVWGKGALELRFTVVQPNLTKGRPTVELDSPCLTAASNTTNFRPFPPFHNHNIQACSPPNRGPFCFCTRIPNDTVQYTIINLRFSPQPLARLLSTHSSISNVEQASVFASSAVRSKHPSISLQNQTLRKQLCRLLHIAAVAFRFPSNWSSLPRSPPSSSRGGISNPLDRLPPSEHAAG